MGILSNSLSRLLDKSLVLDTFFDRMAPLGRNLLSIVRDTMSDFKVVIPFDSRNEKFKYDFDGNMFVVTVKGDGSESETKVTIPNNCIIDELTYSVNNKTKEVVFTIPKDITKDKTILKIKDAAVCKAKETVGWLRDSLKERAEAVAASTSSPRSKKTAWKKKPMYVRDAKGRFTTKKV